MLLHWGRAREEEAMRLWASIGVALEERWRVVCDVGLVTGKLFVVWVSILSIIRGTGQVGEEGEVVVVELPLSLLL